MMAVDGLRVVITGSSRGLGLAFARDLAARGAQLVINGVDAERCTEACKSLVDAGYVAVAIPGSVAEESVANKLIAAAVDHFGGVDAVVNNAGVTRDGTIKRMDVADFDEVVDVHLRGTWLVTRAAVRKMGATGLSVVNVTSGSSLYGLVGQSNYAAAKGGINALTRALTVELAGRGVRLNAVYPRAHTDMTRGVSEHPEIAAHLGAPEDVAPLIAYLASPASAHVSGQLLAFDGRELTVWTHPAPNATDQRQARWAFADFDQMLTDPERLEPLNADAIGRATWEIFGFSA